MAKGPQGAVTWKKDGTIQLNAKVPGTYVKTYGTVTRTHSNATAAALTDSTGGTPGATLAAITAGGTYAQADLTAIKNGMASLAAQVNALIVDTANVKSVLAQLLADLALIGMIG